MLGKDLEACRLSSKPLRCCRRQKSEACPQSCSTVSTRCSGFHQLYLTSERDCPLAHLCDEVVWKARSKIKDLGSMTEMTRGLLCPRDWQNSRCCLLTRALTLLGSISYAQSLQRVHWQQGCLSHCSQEESFSLSQALHLYLIHLFHSIDEN